MVLLSCQSQGRSSVSHLHSWGYGIQKVLHRWRTLPYPQTWQNHVSTHFCGSQWCKRIHAGPYSFQIHWVYYSEIVLRIPSLNPILLPKFSPVSLFHWYHGWHPAAPSLLPYKRAPHFHRSIQSYRLIQVPASCSLGISMETVCLLSQADIFLEHRIFIDNRIISNTILLLQDGSKCNHQNQWNKTDTLFSEKTLVFHHISVILLNLFQFWPQLLQWLC